MQSSMPEKKRHQFAQKIDGEPTLNPDLGGSNVLAVLCLRFVEAFCQPLQSINFSKLTTFALINPFSKSLWIAPAASGAFAPILIVQALVSFLPVVR